MTSKDKFFKGKKGFWSSYKWYKRELFDIYIFSDKAENDIHFANISKSEFDKLVKQYGLEK